MAQIARKKSTRAAASAASAETEKGAVSAWLSRLAFWRGRRLKVLSYVLTFVSGILVTVLFLSAIYPMVTIERLESVNRQDPFAVRLILRNEGFWPIDSIRVDCRVFTIESRAGNRLVETAFEGRKDLDRGLHPKHRTRAKCEPAVKDAARAGNAALSISVSFSPYYLPWEWRRQEAPYVYRMSHGAEGQVVWIPEG
jgi:hypothetical protein